MHERVIGCIAAESEQLIVEMSSRRFVVKNAKTPSTLLQYLQGTVACGGLLSSLYLIFVMNPSDNPSRLFSRRPALFLRLYLSEAHDTRKLAVCGPLQAVQHSA